MSGLPAHDQRQTWPGGISHRSKPAAAMNQSQDWPALCRAGITGLTRVNHNTTSRGICPGPLNSHRLDSLPSRRRVSPLAILLPVNRGTRHLVRATRRQPDPAQSLPNQQCLQAIADLGHIRRRLSNLCSLAGSRNASKRRQELGKVTQGRGFIAQGSVRHD